MTLFLLGDTHSYNLLSIMLKIKSTVSVSLISLFLHHHFVKINLELLQLQLRGSLEFGKNLSLVSPVSSG